MTQLQENNRLLKKVYLEKKNMKMIRPDVFLDLTAALLLLFPILIRVFFAIFLSIVLSRVFFLLLSSYFIEI
jgi:hypothetical protein